MLKADFVCLYCGEPKAGKESSLEHAIPQFMGGDCAPAHFHLTNVCQTCNNRLGLFVDASYGKSWFLTNAFAQAARSLCTAVEDPGLPLVYIGPTSIPGLSVPEAHIAEYWIGPSGETVIWIRHHDERMTSYAGGNPIAARKKPSVAYFFPTSDEERIFWLGLRSFHRAFAKRDARKILAAEIVETKDEEEAVLASLKLDVPSDIDRENIAAIRTAMKGELASRIVANATFSHRFICKMAIAVGFSIFGQRFLQGSVILEARKGLWPKEGAGMSELRGTDPLRMLDANLGSLVGYPGAVAIFIVRTAGHWSLSVSVDEKMPFTVDLGVQQPESNFIDQEEGYALLLFPYLNQMVELTVAGLYSHRLGSLQNQELQAIDARRGSSEAFWESLPSLPRLSATEAKVTSPE